ncbi:hypothetical protein [Hallella sp.]|uniref:hypothetical protein n=1 Tax=Hallella sp. TaxID=2980186 RepID=UPI00307A1570
MKPFRPFLFLKARNSFENGAPMCAAFHPIGNEKKGAGKGIGRRLDRDFSTASTTLFYDWSAGRQWKVLPFRAQPLSCLIQISQQSILKSTLFFTTDHAFGRKYAILTQVS